MRNKIILGLIILFSVTLSAQNYVNFESDVRFDNDGSATFALSHYGEFAITENFGIVDYIAVNNDSKAFPEYAEALVGLYIKPFKNITLGALGGVSTDSKALRIAMVGYYETDRLLLSGFFMNDQNFLKGDADFYDLQLRYKYYTGKKTSLYIGTRYKTGYGFGLPIGVSRNVGEAKLSVFYTTYYNVEDNRIDEERTLPTIGVNLEF